MTHYWLLPSSFPFKVIVPLGIEAVLPLFFQSTGANITFSVSHKTTLQSENVGTDLWKVTLSIPAAPPDSPDDELQLSLIAEVDGEQFECPLVLRRTSCRLNLTAIETEKTPISPQTKAALLWHGWNQYEEVVGIKRFTSGLSGSDVLVLRPKLCDPATLPSSHISDKLRQRIPKGVLSGSWGASLLVKTGPTSKLAEEWERCQILLRDRMTPFVAHNEAHITAQLASEDGTPHPDENGHITWQSTLIGNFLGGAVLPTESLEAFVRGTEDSEACVRTIESLFAVLNLWHSEGAKRKLGDWNFMVGRPTPGQPRKMFARFDLSRDEDGDGYQGRDTYKRGLEWAPTFKGKEHLNDFLLGKSGKEGLIAELEEIPLRFSLTHGDMHPRNALIERNHAWVIDFGHLGVGPTLFDFAHLEVCLRLWCLELEFSSGGAGLNEGVRTFETHLLEHLLGHEAGWQKVRDIAPLVGATPGHLIKIAQTIATVRRCARPFLCDEAEGRDYMAVLYLATLRSLGLNDSFETIMQRSWLVELAWTLEDWLCQSLQRPIFQRKRPTLEPRVVLHAGWLDAPRAPERVVYLLERKDGQAALPEVAALRGVMQGNRHHLDVFDHTLMVLATLEELFSQPLQALHDPLTLDKKVAQSLREQGLHFPAPFCPPPTAQIIHTFEEELNNEIDAVLKKVLTSANCRLLKWVALLHDCGKVASRCVVEGRKGPVINFIGHAQFSVSLALPLLEHLFSDEEMSTRARHLIDGHHTHHDLFDKFSSDQNLAFLAEVFESGDLLPSSVKEGDTRVMALRAILGIRSPNTEETEYKPPLFPEHLPLFLLHGYADSLACRGPVDPYSSQKLSDFNRLMLGIYGRREAIFQREDERRKDKQRLSKFIQTQQASEESLDYRKIRQFREWFEAECKTGSMPTDEAMITKYAEL